MDQLTNRFQAGELVVITARPSMGKSHVMMRILFYSKFSLIKRN
ncbi:hypothetical protein F7731_11810 [Cytobacillus depressus]|uniref:SF4 helicase domain-containing protein n=1 Tax=Cytobacillus depressus TaxID=1602942 RepID=A0A6L3VAP9_9BACI|nr:hypothetical protein F7731_11810 [Cytobacillus depressus]